MIKQLILSFLLCVSACHLAVCQTGIGYLSHIANAEASGPTDSFLKGDWCIEGIVGDNPGVNRKVSSALDASGFKNATIAFRDGSAFGILGKEKIIPGTWKEPEKDRVRISFSKIFTYGMTGRVERQGDGFLLVFEATDFAGFVQRTLAILGRKDTGDLMERIAKGRPRELGFKIGRRQDPPEARNVRDYGADTDGGAIDSPAINKAIEDAARAGGGEVRIPAGTYHCYSIHLASNVTLVLEKGAKIVGARPLNGKGFDLPEKAINTQYQGFGHNHVCNSLMWGIGLENVTICGEGIIDGSCLDSWTEGGPGHGNKAIGLRDCRNVTIKGITIYRGGHFAVHATAVDNLVIDSVTVDSDRDGLDILCCKGVTITNCSVNTPEDDSIVLKSPYTMGCFRDVENVLIADCHISGYRCGTLLDGTKQRFDAKYDMFRSGGRIKLGTESSGGYKRVTVRNCTFDYCGGLILESEDGGDMEDVSISGITMRDPLSSPIFIRLGERMRSPQGTPVGHIRRISVSDVTVANARSWTSCIITGTPGHYVEDVEIKNVNIQFQGGFGARDGRIVPPEFVKDYPEPWMFGTIPAKGFFFRHARNITLQNVAFSYLEKDFRPLFVKSDTNNVNFNNITVNGKKY